MVWNATDDADSYVRATAVHVIGSLVCQSQLWISLLQISHLTEVLSYRNRGNKQTSRKKSQPSLPLPLRLPRPRMEKTLLGQVVRSWVKITEG